MIRRLLRKGHSYQYQDGGDHGDAKGETEENETERDSDTEDNETVTEEIPMEISISVPNLSEITIVRPPVLRSISDNDDRRKYLIRFDRRAKNREKLMSMKRYSGFLKRPEILETVYSVESEDGNEGAKPVEGTQEKKSDIIEDTKKEVKPKMKLAMIRRRESETTEYSDSTDSESMRLIFSSTDQSNCCSEICSRRSSSGSQPNIYKEGEWHQESAKSRSMEDLQGRMKLMDKRTKFLYNNQSVSLDYVEG